MDEKEPLTPETLGVFLAGLGIVAGLINQGSVDREKLIDHLLDLLATMRPHQKSGFYGRYVELALQILEETQFPEPRP